ncbi:hypothetical protein Tco_1365819, partial [Tanacetum coccineum]
MMTFIKEVNLRVSYQAQVCRRESEDFYTQLHDAQTDHKDIRLEIDIVRGQRIAYETELHESIKLYRIMHVTRQGTNNAMNLESIQAMINRAIQINSTNNQDDRSQSLGRGLGRPVQPARVCSYTNFMKCQPFNFKGTEGVVGLSQWLKKMESVFHISHDAAYVYDFRTLKKKSNGQKLSQKVKSRTLKLNLRNHKVRGNEALQLYTQCFQELALMCTKFLADETKKVDKYISGLPDNIYRNVMSARPKTLDDVIELANDLMDQKLCTYAERQNDNKRKADDSSRNNQQPHKKQNVARAYTAGPGACYECGNTGHIKKNYLKLKNRGYGNGNGVAQGRAYALGGRDASPGSNVIT